MNILFFLTPKSEVAHIYEDDTVRQALDKMEGFRYSTIPLLSKDGTSEPLRKETCSGESGKNTR